MALTSLLATAFAEASLQSASCGSGASAARQLLGNLSSCGSRPPSLPFDIGMGLSIYKVLDVNERSGTIRVAGQLDLQWHDAALIWNPNKYEGLSELHSRSEEQLTGAIWQPRLALRNFASAPWSNSDAIGRSLLVRSNGTVSASVPFVLDAWCEFDSADTPFDLQACRLHFATVDYACCDASRSTGASASGPCPVRLVPLRSASLARPALVTHGRGAVPTSDWFLRSTELESSPANGFQCAEAWSQHHLPSEASLLLRLERAPMWYVLYGALPVGVFACVAGLACWLDPFERASERLLLTLFSTLAIPALQFAVLGSVAHSSVLSFADAFCGFALAFCAAQALATLLVVHLTSEFSRQADRQTGRRVDTLLRRVNVRFLAFAALFFVGRAVLLDALRASLALGYSVVTDLAVFCVGVSVFYVYSWYCPACCGASKYFDIDIDGDVKEAQERSSTSMPPAGRGAGAGLGGGTSGGLDDSSMYFHASHVTIVTPDLMATQSSAPQPPAVYNPPRPQREPPAIVMPPPPPKVERAMTWSAALSAPRPTEAPRPPPALGGEAGDTPTWTPRERPRF